MCDIGAVINGLVYGWRNLGMRLFRRVRIRAVFGVGSLLGRGVLVVKEEEEEGEGKGRNLFPPPRLLLWGMDREQRGGGR